MTKGRTVPPQPATRRMVGADDVAATATITADLASVDLALWLFVQAVDFRPATTPDGSIYMQRVGLLITRVADHPTLIKYVITAVNTERILGMIVLGATADATHMGYIPVDADADAEPMIALFEQWAGVVREAADDVLKTRPIPWGVRSEEGEG